GKKGHIERGELPKISRERRIDGETQYHPTDMQRRPHGDGHELKAAVPQNFNTGRGARNGGAFQQAWIFKLARDLCTFPSRGDDLTGEVHIQHRLGADALPVVGERGCNRSWITGCHGFPESEVTCEHPCRLTECLCSLVNQTSEDALSNLELALDLHRCV